MARMSAEQLIGFEAALHELGVLSEAARRFAPLHAAAEADLLPRLREIGALLRSALRRDQWDEALVDAVAREIVVLRDRWQAELEMVRAGAVYRQALAAWKTDRLDELADVVPVLMADARRVADPPVLFAGVPVTTGRRRPGADALAAADECANRIAEYGRDGIESGGGTGPWWDVELAGVYFVDDPDALETPVALRIDTAGCRVPVFTDGTESGFCVYARTLRVPFSVTLPATVEDEWWAVFEGAYDRFRAALVERLRARGIPADVRG